MRASKILTCLLTSAAVAVPMQAFAQQSAASNDASSASDNTIIVTARGFEESIQDVPLAITAFDTEALEKRNIQDLADVARFTAGFAFESLSGGFNSPTIRGQANLRTTALEQPVATFYNGVYLPRQWMTNVAAVDLERIEVVKGPQSSRYGRNAFAGAINFITPSADLDVVTGTVTGTIGTDERLDGAGAVSFPIVPGVLAARASVSHSEFDGTWENTHPNNGLIQGPSTEGNAGGWNRQTYSFSVLFEPVDGLQIEARYLGLEREDEALPAYTLNSDLNQGNCGTVVEYGDEFPASLGGPRLFCGVFGVEGDTVELDPRAYGTYSDTDIYTISVDWDINDALNLSYLFGIVESEADGMFTTEADQINCGGLFNADGVVGFLGTLCNFQGAPTGAVDYESHELRLSYDDGGPFSAGFGVFYSEGEDDRIAVSVNVEPGVTVNDRVTPTISSFPDNIIFVNEVNATDALGIFGEVGFSFNNDATRFLAELRYTEEDLTNTNLRTTPNGVLENTFDFWTPRFTLEHDITPDVLVFATVARGAKAGGFNAGAFAEENRTFEPEFNWTYELGSKGTFFDGQAIINVAAFLTKWSAMQITASDPDNPAPFATVITRNLGDATILGVELESQFFVTDNITIDATASYTDATFDDGTIDAQYTAFSGRFTEPPCDDIVCSTDGDIGGNDLPRSPSFQASIGGEWRDAYNGNGDEIFVRGDVSYQDGFFADTVNLSSSPSRTLVNFRAGIDIGDFQLAVWGRNIFDEKYVSSSQAIVQTAGVNLFPIFYGERSSFGVTGSFSF